MRAYLRGEGVRGINHAIDAALDQKSGKAPRAAELRRSALRPVAEPEPASGLRAS